MPVTDYWGPPTKQVAPQLHNPSAVQERAEDRSQQLPASAGSGAEGSWRGRPSSCMCSAAGFRPGGQDRQGPASET